MSHEIEQFEDGTAAFMGARIPAWHQLGTITPGAVTLEEALRIAQLDWNVTKMPVEVALPDGSYMTVPDQYATVRNHPKLGYQPLGAVGSRYRVIQNAEGGAWLNDLVDESGAHFETAGSLYGGRRVFISLALPQHIGHDLGDDVTPYLLYTNTHDGSGCMEAAVTLMRVVCKNTLDVGLAQAKHRFRIRHTTNALDRLQEARKVLGLTFKYLENFETEMAAMLDQVYVDAQFEALTRQLIPDPEKTDNSETVMHLARDRETLLSLWEAPTQHGIKGTAWGAYNAAVEYADWYSPIRAKDHAQRRAELVLTGANAPFKKRAHDLIRAAA